MLDSWREAEYTTLKYASLARGLSWDGYFKKEKMEEKLWKLSSNYPFERDVYIY